MKLEIQALTRRGLWRAKPDGSDIYQALRDPQPLQREGPPSLTESCLPKSPSKPEPTSNPEVPHAIAQLSDSSYLCGFFFWMDLLGTASMLLDSRAGKLAAAHGESILVIKIGGAVDAGDWYG